ncbi:MAG: hypothetical protein GX335_04595 [Firmicutes bacterium]|nr:hypothetical protein [Bacillota bacterium]
MSRERHADFIEGISLQQIYLVDLMCSREPEPVGERWTVDLRPDFEIVSPEVKS